MNNLQRKHFTTFIKIKKMKIKNLPFISYFIKKYEKYKTKKRLKKKLEELKKRDPFVYKSY